MWRETALLDKMQVLHWFSWDFTRRVEHGGTIRKKRWRSKNQNTLRTWGPKMWSGPCHFTKIPRLLALQKRQASSVRFSWTRQVLHSAPEPSTQPKGSHCSSLFRRNPATVCRRKFEENWSKLHQTACWWSKVWRGSSILRCFPWMNYRKKNMFFSMIRSTTKVSIAMIRIMHPSTNRKKIESNINGIGAISRIHTTSIYQLLYFMDMWAARQFPRFVRHVWLEYTTLFQLWSFFSPGLHW